MFKSDFLASGDRSKEAFGQIVSRAAEIVCQSLPAQPYRGTAARALAELVPSEFLPAAQAPPEQLAHIFKMVVENSVSVSDPATAAHLHCAPLLAAVAAEVVICALNQSMDSFDQASIATVVEQKIVAWLCREAGLPASANGTFTTGGSQCNYMGLLLARDAFLQHTWNWSAQKLGLPPEARRLRILCSDVAHFTVEKSASQLGLGSDAVVRVAVDDHFRMSVAELRRELDNLHSQSLLPLAIFATAGTTDFGSIDPIAQIADIAHEAGAWLHVDAAYGGALLFSPQHRLKLEGMERADSVSIDFHKLFWQPIPCSVFLLGEERNFEYIKLHADYLNPEEHEQEGVPDLVTKSVLTSRRFDALKLWISFESLGRKKLAEMIERTIALANHAADVVRRTPQMELMCEPQLSTVVFRLLSPRGDVDADRLNARVRQQLFESGRAVIGHTRVCGHQCLKFTCMNPTITERQMERLIEMILQAADEAI